jgi:hypothetical protein
MGFVLLFFSFLDIAGELFLPAAISFCCLDRRRRLPALKLKTSYFTFSLFAPIQAENKYTDWG